MKGFTPPSSSRYTPLLDGHMVCPTSTGGGKSTDFTNFLMLEELGVREKFGRWVVSATSCELPEEFDTCTTLKGVFEKIRAREQEMAVLGHFRIAPARIRARYEERNRGYEGGYALPVRYQDELDDSMEASKLSVESARDYVRHFRHTNDDGAWPTDDPEAEIEGIDDVHEREGWVLAHQVAEAERDALKDLLEMA